ncbi:putative serine/threonine protein kinase HRK1 [Sugiyamaella lignohabitans]|uniref:non-specific serine/threonine protein kinase n=1 Tax=Sugiyamaella lignohabitans TaxID=796027 RepID=A0A167FYC5_9ASCO|nr:putative serine/threonine protein kinase HRK1 [Sugiyamaella lignohabitans]ANB15858.1 putative serine/threonine protein kinase HRK1 [Sugiyamaella lignohabitans]
MGPSSSSGFNQGPSSGSSNGGGSDSLMAKVSQKLGDLSLKKNRLLGDGLYERYSLPASRTHSHETTHLATPPASLATTGYSSTAQSNLASGGATAGAVPGSPSSTGKSFLISSSPVRKSPLASPSMLPQYDRLPTVSTGSSLTSGAAKNKDTTQLPGSQPTQADSSQQSGQALTEPAAKPPTKTRPSASFLTSVGSVNSGNGSGGQGDLSNTTSRSSDAGSESVSHSASPSPISTTFGSNPANATAASPSHKAKFDLSTDISRESSNDDSSPSLSAFPSPDRDDPYARSKRPPQVVNPKQIAPRFVFSKKKGHKSNSSLKSLGGGSSGSPASGGHHSSSIRTVIGHTISHNSSTGGNGSGDESGGLHKSHGSMLELKRFFKPSRKHKSSSKSGSSLKSGSTSSSLRHNDSSATLDKTIPFMEEGFKKYGKLGRVLGSGAGGSVRLMKRSSDGTVFAVKEFRLRHANETEREYSKKVTAEFCIGSTLHHPNVIETLDIIHEEGRYYEVMEYCPYDFFAIVMSGKMSTNEIGCCFKQILSGVQYLHEMGLAHRDLKLDNCVVTESGLVKLIDFGSSSVFRYPFEADIVLAHGVVGSDPYLAPEVLSRKDYDPRPADIWSCAIIFCCMTLRRFPWKAPHHNDNSYRLFSSKPDGPVGPNGEPLIPVENRRTHASSSSSSTGTSSNSRHTTNAATGSNNNGPSDTITSSSSSSGVGAGQSTAKTAPHGAGSASHGPVITSPSTNASNATSGIVDILNANTQPQQSVVGNAVASGDHLPKRTTPSRSNTGSSLEGPPPPPVIKGPWRLLRLLHHDSRPIIGHMLKIDPKKRATLEDIMADPWVQSLQYCTIGKNGEFIKATNHEHTFVPPEQAHLEAYKK